MKKLLLPLLVALLGLGVGVGAGVELKPGEEALAGEGARAACGREQATEVEGEAPDCAAVVAADPFAPAEEAERLEGATW